MGSYIQNCSSLQVQAETIAQITIDIVKYQREKASNHIEWKHFFF